MANSWIEQLHFADTKTDTKRVLDGHVRLPGLCLSSGRWFENLFPHRELGARLRPHPPFFKFKDVFLTKR